MKTTARFTIVWISCSALACGAGEPFAEACADGEVRRGDQCVFIVTAGAGGSVTAGGHSGGGTAGAAAKAGASGMAAGATAGAGSGGSAGAGGSTGGGAGSGGSGGQPGGAGGLAGSGGQAGATAGTAGTGGNGEAGKGGSAAGAGGTSGGAAGASAGTAGVAGKGGAAGGTGGSAGVAGGSGAPGGSAGAGGAGGAGASGAAGNAGAGGVCNPASCTAPECYSPICDTGGCGQTPADAGTPCGAAGVCNGTGACGVCKPGSKDCEGKVPRSCDANGQWSPGQACSLTCNGGDCTTVTGLAAGQGHTCANLSSGDLWCWGDSGGIALGVPSETAPTGTPVRVAGLGKVSSVATGQGFTCAVADDAAYCWGTNWNGELGQGKKDVGTHVPQKIAPTAAKVAAGLNSACLLSTKSELSCWGMVVDTPTPTVIPGEFISLSVTWSVVLAATASGDQWCFGDDSAGLCGNGTKGGPMSVPAEVVPLKGLEVSLGDMFGCGLESSAGSVVCWGANDDGQLGRGTTSTEELAPAAALVTSASAVHAGTSFACATQAGKLICWGNNPRGQVTGAPSLPVATPTAVAGLAGVTTFATGGAHTCASNGQAVWCWGFNGDGQLGIGSTNVAIGVQTVLWPLRPSAAGFAVVVPDRWKAKRVDR